MLDSPAFAEQWSQHLFHPVPSMVVEFLRDSVFAERLEMDVRNPSFVFTIPYLGMYGVSGFATFFWIQMTVLAFLQALAGMIAGTLLYHGVAKQRGTQMASLVGGGLVCPFMLVLPFMMVNLLEIRNPALLIASASNSVIMLFRCLEVMFATTPKFAEESLGMFLCYFSTVVQFDWDPATEQPVQVSPAEIASKIGSVGLPIRGILSALQYHDTLRLSTPFLRAKSRALWIYYGGGNLANSYLVGALLKITLEGGLTAAGVVMSVYTGLRTVDVNLYPLTATSSPSDFWGRRWNRLVSNGLKRAVFKPLRMSGLSRPLAALATFMASGLLHEYMLIVVAMYHPSRGDSATAAPSYGNHLVFFLWNAVVLVSDGLLRGTKAIEWAERNIPSPLRTVLVLMTVLPVVHLFTDEYVNMGFYSAFSLGFARFYRL